ncbi:C4-dicarboxylate TRAP transporter substrate-binding protein [Chelativorans sp. SCAU2101]|uniref:C4-dicarboxylate TRAP transporter substrate-binding protein n=1 Tax=Chelativorans petroleitrophicus TaxID=2975484 RepID=A0A9X2X751_9HYPH|nr:C4-dicarboxylate TRAP transporter substrate-binding protein [Chelativorans petroleitrophicus]MCT8990537.1 C4-dicarboxylate TRAP transporter substrate-binding protein [Chelativorans petroleitrophicus]
MKRIAYAVGLATGLLLSAGVLQAEELRLAPGAPPSHPAHTPLYVTLAEELPKETDGTLTGNILGPEVANVGNMKGALQSGVVQVGNLLPLYFPGDLPNSALMGDLAFLGRDPQVMGAAMTEYVVTCEDCQEEFKKLGAVFAGAGSSDVYVLLTTKPVRTPDDIKGMRLRSGGSPFARWAEYIGASPVNVPVNDTFESMSQGVIDGTMGSAADLTSYRLIDLAKYIIDLPLGTYHATVNFAVNTDAWKAMSPEQRRGFVRAANKANIAFTQTWGYERSNVAREEAEKAGLEVIKPDQALFDVTESFVEDDLKAVVGIAESQYGITDAEAKIARFRELVEKWTKIIDEVGHEPEAIAAATQKEVWDKVDYESYGM